MPPAIQSRTTQSAVARGGATGEAARAGSLDANAPAAAAPSWRRCSRRVVMSDAGCRSQDETEFGQHHDRPEQISDGGFGGLGAQRACETFVLGWGRRTSQ